MNWLRENWRTALLLAGIWLLFECWISWMAFCQHSNDAYGYYKSAEKDYCIFGGPVGSIARAFGHWWGHVFDKPDAYVALFTAVLAACTLALWWATYGLQKTTAAQIELARSEFLSTHRPKIRIKHIWFIDPLRWRADEPLEVNIDFVNIGSTDARITWINYQSLLVPANERLPQRPPYDEIPEVGERITRFRTDAILSPGITFARPVCDGILDRQEVHDILWGSKRLYFIGTIEYWDAGGKLRQTAFCRCLTYNNLPPQFQDLGRIEVELDPDYQYED